jgi:hypothetical protein
MASLLDGAVERVPLAVEDGKSGNRMERAVLPDGRVLVVKHVTPLGDWLMRATGDDGRLARLWAAGVLDRVPAAIDHAMLAVEPAGAGWRVVMRDVSALLVPEGVTVSRADSRRLLAAAAALHQAFWGAWIDGLCTLADRWAFLSPAAAARERARGGTDLVPRLVPVGWERFAELVPADVAAAVAAVHADPEGFASRFDGCGQTLVHGDLKLGNLGLAPDRVVVIDWGDRAGIAPPAVEFAWYLAANATRIAASRDELVADFVAAEEPRHDGRALRLALLGGLVQLGWNKALNATEPADEALRAMEAADLAWWVAQARLTLEAW